MRVTKIIVVSLLTLSGCVPAAPFVVPEGHPASVESPELTAWSGPAIFNQVDSFEDAKSKKMQAPMSSSHQHMHGGH